MKPLTSASPHAILMVGIPGSGKSTFAENFAETFRAPVISQTSLQRTYGLSFSAAQELRDSLLGEFIKTKHTLIIDGGLDTKGVRESIAKYLTKNGYRPMLVWVQTDTNESHRRATRPYPKGSGITSEEFNIQLDAFEPPVEKERATVISGKHTYNSQLKIVLRQLATGKTTPPKYRQTPKPSIQPARVAAQVSTDAVKPVGVTVRSRARNDYRR